MFKRIHANGIASQEGFEFEVSGRESLRYIENDRELVFEFSDGNPGTIDFSIVKTWNHGNIQITDYEKGVIRSRVERALRHLKLNLEFK